jgi:hypothetical protein
LVYCSEHEVHTGFTKKNAGISGTCSVGTKTDVRVLLAVFYLSIQTVLFPTSGKVVRYETLYMECHL